MAKTTIKKIIYCTGCGEFVAEKITKCPHCGWEKFDYTEQPSYMDSDYPDYKGEDFYGHEREINSEREAQSFYC